MFASLSSLGSSFARMMRSPSPLGVMGAHHAALHRLCHLPAARLVADAVSLEQPVVHILWRLTQVVAVDEEEPGADGSLRAPWTALGIAGAPCHHAQHLLARPDVLAQLGQTADLRHAPPRLLRRLEGGQGRRRERLRLTVLDTVEVAWSPKPTHVSQWRYGSCTGQSPSPPTAGGRHPGAGRVRAWWIPRSSGA